MEMQVQMSAGARPAVSGGNSQEFLSFTLGHEDYGVDILKVQEIRGYEKPTAIANAPAFMKGVVNLRGTIVPIIDMRMKFNLGEPSYDQFTVVIILNVAGRTVGIVVDGVSDVLALPAGQIRAAPEFSAVFDTQYIIGLGTVEQRMLILVDIDKLMSSNDMALMDSASIQ
jgi:purine-binding chemotaxis protein CheW